VLLTISLLYFAALQSNGPPLIGVLSIGVWICGTTANVVSLFGWAFWALAAKNAEIIWTFPVGVALSIAGGVLVACFFFQGML
jgi:hypothetical protein